MAVEQSRRAREKRLPARGGLFWSFCVESVNVNATVNECAGGVLEEVKETRMEMCCEVCGSDMVLANVNVSVFSPLHVVCAVDPSSAIVLFDCFSPWSGRVCCPCPHPGPLNFRAAGLVNGVFYCPQISPAPCLETDPDVCPSSGLSLSLLIFRASGAQENLSTSWMARETVLVCWLPYVYSLSHPAMRDSEQDSHASSHLTCSLADAQHLVMIDGSVLAHCPSLVVEDPAPYSESAVMSHPFLPRAAWSTATERCKVTNPVPYRGYLRPGGHTMAQLGAAQCWLSCST